MKIFELLAAGTAKLKPGDINNLFQLPATEVLAIALNIFYFMMGALAVIIIILAGFTFMTSAGDPAKITKARNAILYSVIGLVVVMFAFAITQFVLGRF